jgi:hypothetical protein
MVNMGQMAQGDPTWIRVANDLLIAVLVPKGSLVRSARMRLARFRRHTNVSASLRHQVTQPTALKGSLGLEDTV